MKDVDEHDYDKVPHVYNYGDGGDFETWLLLYMEPGKSYSTHNLLQCPRSWVLA